MCDIDVAVVTSSVNEVKKVMGKSGTINVKGNAVGIFQTDAEDYISLTDIAKYRDVRTEIVIQNWMRTRMTIELLGLWETLNNPDFKHIEFDVFKNQAGLNGFVLSPKQWIEKTDAIGIISKSGRYGGTFAHKDIAFEFATWISVEFKLLLIKEFQRLKTEEQQRLSQGWDLQRTIAKINYRIHTDAIKAHIIPPVVTKEQKNAIYASEADLLNVALFGQTAGAWRKENEDKDTNVRDHAALEQLVVLSNMESINALLIQQGMPQGERLTQLNQVAITQLTSLLGNQHIEIGKYDGNSIKIGVQRTTGRYTLRRFRGSAKHAGGKPPAAYICKTLCAIWPEIGWKMIE